MLGTYFVAILVLFIALITGAVIGYTQKMDKFKEPMRASMEKYDPTSEKKEIKALTNSWDQVQKDVRECINVFARAS